MSREHRRKLRLAAVVQPILLTEYQEIPMTLQTLAWLATAAYALHIMEE